MKRLIFCSLLCLTASVAQAKTLYVDANNGNDNTSYAANSSQNPWASIGRAAWGSTSIATPNTRQAARAGDVVIVRSGTYRATSGTNERYIPIYNPVNSGTNNSPIVFRAEGEVTLSSDTSTEGEPLIGTYDKSFIVWDGFTLDERNINTKSDTGPIVVWESNNITLQNLTVRGITSSWNDNHNAIRIERARDVTVRNNFLSGTRNVGYNKNASSVMLYYSNDIIVENNTIFDSATGVFIKGANGGPVTVRNNYFYDLDKEAVALGGIGTQSEQFGAKIYQNIVRDSEAGITFIGYDRYSPANVDVVNNTIYNCSLGGILLKPNTTGYRDLVFANNVFVGNSRGIQGEDISDLSAITFHNNLYYDNDVVARIAYDDYPSLSSWQSTFNQDTAGSLSADPEFTNTAGNSFSVSGGSVILDAGVDILNLQGEGTGSPINLGARVTGSESIGASTAITQPTAINFAQTNIRSYGGPGQDVDGTVQVNNHSINMTGNTWKRIAFPYTVTRNTMIELDFQSNSEGEIQGIGFDVDNTISTQWTFNLYGQV
jgi:hypothetical protein